MSGLVWASLALLALYNGSLKLMWLWLIVALVVDGVDGTLARRVRIKEAVPWFDGSVTDIIIDYLTWTFIPGVFMYLYLPLGPKPLAGVLVLVALVSSLFCYANEGEKSADNYFVGFPAAWNVVAVMMWVLHTPALANIICTVVLAILTLVPTHYAHPMRVVKRRSLLIVLVLAWIAGTVWLLAVYPSQPLPAMLLSVVCGGWFLAIGVLRTLQGRPDEVEGALES
ncbi:CDP-alcohol phosphatidyltransferase family protein [Actinomyces trachealis]|uniref:CDP-alcohol phosphatidyltransferase family protein n=1 Tax=Actinomyces trachealis TaxID=2763540 RepID=UPI001F298C7C|nr:CDP-alcohol phosphatidyltransferase family protein [Actinomyces trachealis]